MNRRHAADLAFRDRHQFHFDRRFFARPERAERPEDFAARALRRPRIGAQQPRSLGDHIADFDLAGGNRIPVLRTIVLKIAGRPT